MHSFPLNSKILMMPNNRDLELVKKQTIVFSFERRTFFSDSGKLYIFLSCFIPFSQIIFLSVLVCVQDCFPLYQSSAMPTSLSDLQFTHEFLSRPEVSPAFEQHCSPTGRVLIYGSYDSKEEGALQVKLIDGILR